MNSLMQDFKKIFPIADDIIDKSHIYLWSKDRKGKYLSCNKNMYLDLGLNKETDVLGLTDLDLCWRQEANGLKQNDEIVMVERQAKIFSEAVQIINDEKIAVYSYKTPLIGRSRKILGTMGIGFGINQNTNNKKHLQNKLIENNDVFKELSLREQQCIKYYLQGYTAKETANILFLSYRTVEEYFSKAKRKLGYNNKRELFKLLNVA